MSSGRWWWPGLGAEAMIGREGLCVAPLPRGPRAAPLPRLARAHPGSLSDSPCTAFCCSSEP